MNFFQLNIAIEKTKPKVCGDVQKEEKINRIEWHPFESGFWKAKAVALRCQMRNNENHLSRRKREIPAGNKENSELQLTACRAQHPRSCTYIKTVNKRIS